MKNFSKILSKKWGGLTLWGSLIFLLSLYPLTGASGIQLFTATQIFLWVILASNWNLIGGMTGYLDFGHAVFFGIGAYTMGILVTNSSLAFAPKLSFWQALPWTGISAVIFALLIGWAPFRRKVAQPINSANITALMPVQGKACQKDNLGAKAKELLVTKMPMVYAPIPKKTA